MNFYEAVIVLQPQLSAEKMQEAVQKVKDIVSKHGGTVQAENKWGKRGLAYSIKKKREGYVVLLSFQADPSKINLIHQAYRLLEEEVLRALIIKKEQPQAANVVGS